MEDNNQEDEQLPTIQQYLRSHWVTYLIIFSSVFVLIFLKPFNWLRPVEAQYVLPYWVGYTLNVVCVIFLICLAASIVRNLFDIFQLSKWKKG